MTKMELFKENIELRKLLEEAIEDRELELKQANYPRNTPEVKWMVEQGKNYGYGALMGAASLAWSDSLKASMGTDSGIFIPTVCKGSIECWIKRAKAIL